MQQLLVVPVMTVHLKNWISGKNGYVDGGKQGLPCLQDIFTENSFL